MLKPDLRTSEKVAGWPVEVRYFWVLLWGYLDDYGKGKDNPQLIKADCFPLDDDITGAMVDDWLWLLADAGVIDRYEVDGRNYLVAVNWSEHQKPQHPAESKVPDRGLHASRMKDARNRHEGLMPGFGFELGLVKEGSSPGAVTEAVKPVPDRFPEFWDAWPRKEGRAEARKAWSKATRRTDQAVIVAAAQAYASSPFRPARQFVPHAATWLNGERWTDPPPLPPERESRVAPAPVVSVGDDMCRRHYNPKPCPQCEEESA